MSFADLPPTRPTPPDRPPGPPSRDGCLTVFMIIIGVILLLPGVCALIFAFAPHYDSFFTPFVVLGLIVSMFGVVMIRAAIRGPKR